MRLLFPILIGLAGSGPSRAAAPIPEAYRSAVRYVDQLFLGRGEIEAVDLLRAAARGVEGEVHWLRVARVDGGVTLSHGDGAGLGTVQVADMDDLPRALASLEARVLRRPVDDVDVRLAVLDGFADALDRYSRILADERLTRFNVRLSGTLVGIGATFRLQDDAMRVHQIQEDGPAKAGGLQVGDEVERIDGRSTVNMPLSEATRRLRGASGTPVALEVRRRGDTVSVTLTRALVTVPNVTHRILEDDVGYVHIDHISQRTVENLRRALDDLDEAGALDNGLVIDLRDNTGGSMREAARLADLFLDHGVLLRTAGRDGGRVLNLESEMRASPSSEDLDIPLVLVVNRLTASGSEILAGALLEHDRAALVGTRTYGKGTVQKSYPLAAGVNLKLTVARYILANDRQITEAGLVPDVAVGEIRLDGSGVQFLGGWRQDRLAGPWGDILPEVDERPGWRGRDADTDLPLEMARRAVAGAVGPSRGAVLAELRRHAATMRATEETRLAEALLHRGIDWTPASDEGSFPDAEVVVTAEAIGGDTYRLSATVTNAGDTPLHQTLVQLDCASFSLWDDRVIAVGRIAPGQDGRGELLVTLSPGIGPRLDAVSARLRTSRRPPLRIPPTTLAAASRPLPAVRVSAALRDGPLGTGPHGHSTQQTEVTVTNLSVAPIPGLEVHFGYPDDTHVELLDRAARASHVMPRSDAVLTLGVEVAPAAPLVLPMDLVVEADTYGTLAEWSLSLPTTGDLVGLQAPRIDVRIDADRAVRTEVVQLPVTVTDDRWVEHVVVWVNGDKVAWAAGTGPRVAQRTPIRLLPGHNRIVVEARDDQGIAARRVVDLLRASPPAGSPAVGSAADD